MKLLLDHNLSPRLVPRLSEVYPECTHVAALRMDSASDLVIWQYARQNNYCLVTKDGDFNDLLAAKGFPPKVIWLRLGNCTTAEIADLLLGQSDVILDFMQNPVAGLLELF